MTRARIATAPSQLQPPAAHIGQRTSRRAAQGSAPATPLSERVLLIATLPSVAVVLLLLVWAALGTVAASPGPGPAGGRQQVGIQPARTINPLFIVQPHTVTQAAGIGTLQLVLAANPALPGPNHFVVTLVDHGWAITGARVRMAATMSGMIMRPLSFPARERQGGHYTGAASLSMFGRWQLTVVVERRQAAPVMHVFALNLDLPSRLLKALGAHGGTR